ncbi:MAG: MBOAT family protein [Bacteroidales bacterium]|nr:MBOAT family protein [Bacteroidales bacterium]
MVFSSHIFLLYFLPAFLLVYFLVPSRWRNLVLLVASVLFYAWGAPDFVLVLLASTVGGFYLVKVMASARSQGTRKLLLGVAVALPIGLLAWFKYANFFVDNINAVLASLGLGVMTWTKVLLPIGISFFSFQSVTYAVDVYRGECTPMRKLTDYMLYITMFPQLIAGPIVRYNEIADQITNRRRLRWDECLQGFYRFTVGLAKKVLVADVLGRTVDTALAGDLSVMDMPTAWITIAAYTMQLYFDFSGYSDMAIGLGRIMGFRFPENFDKPYNSGSVSEFWRRWHITLGNFMRNYLYIPLGGNRRGVVRTYFNLWIVFLLSGLWHGAGWNFVIWGAWHGLFLVLERLTGYAQWQKLKPFRVVLTTIVVMVGWSIFRIEDMSQCLQFVGRMFSFRFDTLPTWQPQFYVTVAVALLLAFIPWKPRFERQPRMWMWVLMCLLFFFCVGALTATDFSPFIYFRF